MFSGEPMLPAELPPSIFKRVMSNFKKARVGCRNVFSTVGFPSGYPYRELVENEVRIQVGKSIADRMNVRDITPSLRRHENLPVEYNGIEVVAIAFTEEEFDKVVDEIWRESAKYVIEWQKRNGVKP